MVRIWIRDNISGDVREYGTDQHDSLVIQEDGSLHYYNMQNGCGTMFPEEGYSFCLEEGITPDEMPYGRYIDIGGES